MKVHVIYRYVIKEKVFSSILFLHGLVNLVRILGLFQRGLDMGTQI